MLESSIGLWLHLNRLIAVMNTVDLGLGVLFEANAEHKS